MNVESHELRWPGRKLIGDYVRGVVGVAFASLCVLLAPSGSWWQILLLGLLFLFLAFLSDVLIRHGTRIMLTPVALIRRRPIWGEDRIPWTDIEGLDVRFYPTRRDRTKGWMTARVNGPKSSIALDDQMSGFEDVMDRAMHAMEVRGIGMNEATTTNLSSLGLGLRRRSPK